MVDFRSVDGVISNPSLLKGYDKHVLDDEELRSGPAILMVSVVDLICDLITFYQRKETV